MHRFSLITPPILIRRSLRLKNIIASALMLFVLTLSACSSGTSDVKIREFVPAAQNEGISLLKNPYRGFFYMCGFMLNDRSTPQSQKEKLTQHIEAQNADLYLLQINLSAYSESDLSRDALNQVKAIFECARDSDVTAMVRFLYDWDNLADLTEPSDIEQIAAHMKQLGPIVTEYKDVIFLIQGTFTGNCGEMNNSRFESVEDYRYLVNTLAENVAPSVFLSVRTPWQQRGVTDSFCSVTDANAFDGSVASRLGLFNDGMMGSESDLGSYGSARLDNASDPSSMGTRDDELDFQDRLCSYVPNGGEVIYGEDTSFIEPNNAIRDLDRMHITYLNRDHDANAINLWKRETYHGEGAFDGASVYEYINAHLGYRYYIDGADLHQDANGASTLKLDLRLGNMGYAPCYRELKSAFYLIPVNSDGSLNNRASVKLPVSFDTRSIAGGSSETYSFDLDISPLAKTGGKSFKLCFGLTDPATDRNIQFANDYRTLTDDNLVILGDLTLQS